MAVGITGMGMCMAVNAAATAEDEVVKKTKDVGLQYMMELGLRPAKTPEQFYSMLQEKCGKEQMDAIRKYIRARGDVAESGEKCDNAAFYKLKNSSLGLSLAVSGGFDGEFIRKVCNLIASKADKYRNCARILEVGCDCGILSCFLGRTFPATQIVSIDRCGDSIAVAKELAQRLGISNVTFLQADIHDYPEEKYDAIFSIRVMHENRFLGEKEDHTLLMDTQAEMFAAATAEYAEVLSNKLVDNGLLLSIERSGLNPALYGWMLALNNHGIIAQEYERLFCQEIGEEAGFQALDMQKANSILEREKIRNQFAMCFFGDNGELTEADYGGWEASIVLQLFHGDLLDGAFAYVDGQKAGKIAVWKSAACESDILIEQHSVRADIHVLGIRDMAMLEEIMEQVSNEKRTMEREWRATLKPFNVEDGKEVEI